MSLQIVFPGPLTTVQDLGRKGYGKDAFSVSGVMDRYAAITANRLVGNEDNAAVLEMTVFGIRAVALDRTLVCFSGASFPVKVNGQLISLNTAVELHPGDLLDAGAAKDGCRGYLAVRGGFDVEKVMGSRSTNLKCGVGGFCGRKLVAGDILPVAPVAFSKELEGGSFSTEKYFGDRVTLRVIPGPQNERFDQTATDTFFNSEYTVTPQSDRMGIRLSGAMVTAKDGMDIVSDGVVPGCIQIPDSGQPIILGVDCQTTGGYAKIATVITADLPAMGQLRPGNKIKFEVCTVEEAHKILRNAEKLLPPKAKR